MLLSASAAHNKHTHRKVDVILEYAGMQKSIITPTLVVNRCNRPFFVSYKRKKLVRRYKMLARVANRPSHAAIGLRHSIPAYTPENSKSLSNVQEYMEIS